MTFECIQQLDDSGSGTKVNADAAINLALSCPHQIVVEFSAAAQLAQMCDHIPMAGRRTDTLLVLLAKKLDSVLAKNGVPGSELRFFGVGDEAVKIEDGGIKGGLQSFSSLAFSMSRCFGMRNQNVEPLPCSDSAQMVPRCTSSTRCFTRKRPRPVP